VFTITGVHFILTETPVTVFGWKKARMIPLLYWTNQIICPKTGNYV